MIIPDKKELKKAEISANYTAFIKMPFDESYYVYNSHKMIEGFELSPI